MAKEYYFYWAGRANKKPFSILENEHTETIYGDYILKKYINIPSNGKAKISCKKFTEIKKIIIENNLLNTEWGESLTEFKYIRNNKEKKSYHETMTDEYGNLLFF